MVNIFPLVLDQSMGETLTINVIDHERHHQCVTRKRPHTSSCLVNVLFGTPHLRVRNLILNHPRTYNRIKGGNDFTLIKNCDPTGAFRNNNRYSLTVHRIVFVGMTIPPFD